MKKKDRKDLVWGASKNMKENNDCAVKAVSLATGASYQKVHRLMKKHGRKDRCATPKFITRRVIKELGFVMVPIGDRHPMQKAKTIASLTPRIPSRGAFLVSTRGHILALRGGKVLDWTDGRRHRIKNIFRVSKAS